MNIGALLFGLLIAGCGGSTASHPRMAVVAVRDCSSSGEHGLTRAAYVASLHVGPLWLGGLADRRAIASRATETNGRFPAFESVAVLKAGSTATITIPAAERSTVGLLYDKAKFRDDGLYLVSSLEPSVRFTACRSLSFNGGVSQFDGGLVVTRAQCVELDFQIDGDPGTIRRYIPFGRPCSHAGS